MLSRSREARATQLPSATVPATSVSDQGNTPHSAVSTSESVTMDSVESVDCGACGLWSDGGRGVAAGLRRRRRGGSIYVVTCTYTLRVNAHVYGGPTLVWRACCDCARTGSAAVGPLLSACTDWSHQAETAGAQLIPRLPSRSSRTLASRMYSRLALTRETYARKSPTVPSADTFDYADTIFALLLLKFLGASWASASSSAYI